MRATNLLFTGVILFQFLMGCSDNRSTPIKKPVKESGYHFSVINQIESLPVMDQNMSGTCWSFATTSFLESEILRITGEQIDLSEMYFVRGAYRLKASNYIMRQGTSRFTEGGLNHDPLLSARAYGMVPQSAYTGLKNNETIHDHREMSKSLLIKVKEYANPSNKLGPAWKTEILSIMDGYMGKPPMEFQYNGKKFTPSTFSEYTRLNLDDYLTITSFSHAEFYTPFILNIPANWANESFYNLPLDEFMINIDQAIDAGYSLALDLDATEKTFSRDYGIAVMPEKQTDSDIILTFPRPEMVGSQELRQSLFERFYTTDDHLMHLIGKVRDQNGKIYYMAKNSWGVISGKEGVMYLSAPYLRMKAISVMLHKDGLTRSTKEKLGPYLQVHRNP